jgi:hypothetical protein
MVTQGGDFQPNPAEPSSYCNWEHIDSLRDYGSGTGTGIAALPECHVMENNTWHQLELEVRIGLGYTFWIDGTKIIDINNVRPPSGPYGQIYLSNYITGYGLGGNHPMAGNGTFGNGLWRIYYDNLIISRNCIHNCGS